MSLEEQSSNIKFCVKLGKTFTATLALMRQAHAEEAMSRTRVYEWHKRFTSGRLSTDDDPRSGRPRSARREEMIALVAQKIRRNRRQPIDDVATLLGISHGSVQSILYNDLKI
ncbi:hypothetical protein ANN_18481 [Periplaneta americana]|uniref:Mos1 transposase HTH domain-containing protein n=1 Tax=Periplaneta americana TaxID=6978 RepID=A0ABQ8SQ44_PERAM|nr:hypothetical protein ANN_18481 [Periplaneta americana]